MPGPDQLDVSQRFDKAIAAYMLRIDRGEDVDVEAFVAGYPDLTAELLDFFADNDAVSDALECRPAPEVIVEPAAKLPRRLDDYELLEVLGRGGMGTVYKARHIRLHRLVAVKTLTHGVLASQDTVDRFQRETAAIGALEHQNVVLAYDAREVDDTHFLVMELIDGIDLRRLLEGAKPLPIRAVAEISRQAAVGLGYVHDRGFVHRDVKPTNLMVTPDGTVKLLDLGLALFRDQSTAAGEMTATGIAMGTVDYMAPEQAVNAHGVDLRADLYSLGCTLYYLLAGHAPFDTPDRSSNVAKIQAHVSDSPRPIGEIRSDVPELLAMLIHQMLAKKPEDRPSTAGEVARRLAEHAEGADLPTLVQAASAFTASPRPACSNVASTEPRNTACVDTSTVSHSRGAADQDDRPRRVHATRWMVSALVLLAVVSAVGVGWIKLRPSSSLSTDHSGTLEATSPDATSPESTDVVVERAFLTIRRHKRDESLEVHAFKDGKWPSNETLQPLAAGDDFKIEIHLSRPTYWCLVWLDTQGVANVVAESAEPEATVEFPAGNQLVEVDPSDPSGLHLLMLCLSDSAISSSRTERLEKALAQLGPPAKLPGGQMVRLRGGRGAGAIHASTTNLSQHYCRDIETALPAGFRWVYQTYLPTAEKGKEK